jgi:hypothetical protein
MFRFLYRRAWSASVSAAAAPLGFWSRLVQLVGGRGKRTPAVSSVRTRESPPRPFVSIRIKGPVGSRRLKSALLDTGSQDTLFPIELSDPLGIVLGEDRQTIHWHGQGYGVEFQTVELEIVQDAVVWGWRAHVGFTHAPLSYGLLGQRGCLDFFDAKFCGADQFVELERNREFPQAAR